MIVNRKYPNVIIFHHNDNDGVVAAFIIKQKYDNNLMNNLWERNVTCIPCSYGETYTLDYFKEQVEKYYVCNRTGEKLLCEAIRLGVAKSTDPRFDISLLVSGLWGCIESVLLKKCEVEYWDKGKSYTDRFIKMWCKTIFVEN